MFFFYRSSRSNCYPSFQTFNVARCGETERKKLAGTEQGERNERWSEAAAPGSRERRPAGTTTQITRQPHHTAPPRPPPPLLAGRRGARRLRSSPRAIGIIRPGRRAGIRRGDAGGGGHRFGAVGGAAHLLVFVLRVQGWTTHSLRHPLPRLLQIFS
jgi:hypothetical protein